MSDFKLFDKKFDKRHLNCLLESFSKFTISKTERELNFFDIAGYPHYENVVSNILSFYFDTKAKHDMKDLWIKSLVKVYNKKENKKEYEGSIETPNGIERETNANNKRIDLLMVANEFIIVIENKIYADDGYNPFDYYHSLAKEKAKENELNEKNLIEILLSLEDRGNKDDKERGYHFVNIRYDELFDEVKNNVGQYIVNAKEKWIIYMNEFVKNIANLMENSKMKVDKDLQLQYANNDNYIQHFLNVICTDFDNKAGFFKELFNILIKENNIENIQTRKLSNNLISDVGGVFVKLKNNKELGVYFNRENHPETIKFGIRDTMNDSDTCRLEIETIHNKCVDLKLLDSTYKDESIWKYNVIKELNFCDLNCTIENVSQIFKSLIDALDNY